MEHFPMHMVEFAITTYCQARCRACPRTDERTGKAVSSLNLQHTSIEDFKNLTKSFNQIKLNNIAFCGEHGDPMMNPNIDLFIEEALKYSPRVSISTNGGIRKPLWYSNSAKKFGNEKLHIKFAIDGASNETNWHYREGVIFDKAIQNMTTFVQSGGFGKWKFIIFDWNWHEIVKAYDIAKNIIGCEIEYGFNRRNFINSAGLQGHISDTNKEKAYSLLKEINYEV